MVPTSMSLPRSNQTNVQTNMGPPMESGPGPADPALSAAKSSYVGTGYGSLPPVGGTINVGTPVSVPSAPVPVQIRAFRGSDGNLYFLDNDNNAYEAAAGGALKPIPPYYAPTK